VKRGEELRLWVQGAMLGRRWKRDSDCDSAELLQQSFLLPAGKAGGIASSTRLVRGLLDISGIVMGI